MTTKFKFEKESLVLVKSSSLFEENSYAIGKIGKIVEIYNFSRPDVDADLFDAGVYTIQVAVRLDETCPGPIFSEDDLELVFEI